MIEWFDQKVRLRFMFLLWWLLLLAFSTKLYLLASGHQLRDLPVMSLTLLEETLWVLLQPISIVVFTLRQWKKLTPAAQSATLVWFWVPMLFLVSIFVKKCYSVALFGSPTHECNKLDVALEILWLYFPVAQTVSWYIRSWQQADASQRWRCKHLFFPLVGTLYATFLVKWGVILLFDVPCNAMLPIAASFVEEFLWVVLPGLGIWAERSNRKNGVMIS